VTMRAGVRAWPAYPTRPGILYAADEIQSTGNKVLDRERLTLLAPVEAAGLPSRVLCE
jgi:hypothetical protein